MGFVKKITQSVEEVQRLLHTNRRPYMLCEYRKIYEELKAGYKYLNAQMEA